MWEDFERGIRSEFKDHLEKKDARAKLKRTKQTNKVREYISLMQSLNIDAGCDEEFLWETIYDGLKPKLKEMWATIVSPPGRPAGEVRDVSEAWGCGGGQRSGTEEEYLKLFS